MNAPPTEPPKASTLRSYRVLGLDDFEVWRRRGTGLLIFASALVLAYWVLWFSDRGVVGTIELATNLATAAMGIGVMSVGWRFRHELLAASTNGR